MICSCRRPQHAAADRQLFCGSRPCLTDTDPQACSQTCVEAETGLSQACSTCFVATILCSISSCAITCIDKTKVEECRTCQGGDNPNKEDCLTPFFICTGYETSCTDKIDSNGNGKVDCDDDSCKTTSDCPASP